MASYLVFKLPNVMDATNPIPTAFIAENKVDSAIAAYEPGEDLVLIEDATDWQDAERQAEAYWNGTHQEPERINAWFEWALDRKKEL